MSIRHNCTKSRCGEFSAKISKCTVFLAALCAVAPLFADTVTIDPNDYKYTFAITFPGYTGSTTLTDFPALIRLSPELNAFNYSKCMANGGDLRFADSDGNLLSSEVDTWNENGESLVWVKVPTLDSSTAIKAYYGYKGDGNPPSVDPKDVWSSGFVAVWHMNDATLPMMDSSNGETSLTENKSGAALLGQSGLVGNAVEFDQLSDHTGCFQTTDQRYKTSGRTDFTVEFWSYQDSFEPTVLPRNVYFMRETGSSTIWQAYGIKSTSYGSPGKTVVQVTRGNGKTENPSTGDRYPLRGEWTYQNFRLEDTTKFYQGLNRNPRVQANTYADGITNDTANTTLYIGNTSKGSTSAFPGKIDEVRISSVARSDDWMNATYDMMTDLDFALYAPDNDWDKYTHAFTVSFPGATNGVLSAFPVLVKVSTNDIPGFSYTDCLKPNGGDLRFADENGNLLDSEIETWDTNGVSLVWVNVPTLTRTTAIKAYYGWSFAPGVNSQNVWTNGFVGVWHLDESENPLHASVYGATNFKTFPGSQKAPDTTSGILWAQSGAVGKAVNFKRWDDYTNSCVRADYCAAYEGMGALTVEAWTYRDSTVLKGGYVLDMVQRPGSNQAYCMYDKSNSRKVEFDFWNTNGTKTSLTTSGNVSADTWVYQAATYDSESETANNAILYINGSASASAAGGNAPVKATGSSGYLHLGNAHNYTGYNLPFPGLIDEVRISNVARSAEWLATTYDMIKGNPTFATYSAAREQTKGYYIFFR